MPLVFPALDLAAILTFAVVLVLALTVKVWLKAIFDVVNKLVGWVPLVGNWIAKGEDHVLSALNVVVVKTRGAMSACLDGMRWSLREFETGVRDFAELVQDNWQQLVVAALPAALRALYASAHGLYSSVDNRVDNLAGRVNDVGPAIRKAADNAETRAVNAAGNYADALYGKAHDFTVDHVRGVYKEVEADIAGATARAEAYADRLVGDLRHAEDAAIAAVGATAAAALESVRSTLAASIAGVQAGLTALRTTLEAELAQLGAAEASALAGAVSSLTGAIATAEQAAEQAASAALTAEAGTLEAALASASSAAASALEAARTALEGELSGAINAAAADLHAIAAELEAGTGAAVADARAIAAQLTAVEAAAAGELTDIYNLPADAIRDLLNRLDLTKVASIGAGLVLVRALVNAIAQEAGLDSAECRAKHKQICATPGSSWSSLLEGLLALGFVASLPELARLANGMADELVPIVREAA